MNVEPEFSDKAPDLSEQEKADKKQLMFNHEAIQNKITDHPKLSDRVKGLLASDISDGLSLHRFKTVYKAVEAARSNDLAPMLALYFDSDFYQQNGEDIDKGINNYTTQISLTAKPPAGGLPSPEC